MLSFQKGESVVFLHKLNNITKCKNEFKGSETLDIIPLWYGMVWCGGAVYLCSKIVHNKKEHRILEHKNMRKAFTLAEVLITLGIIGVVAAMTLPTLITNYQKRATVAKLKRAYSVIKQAYLMSYDQVGDPTADEALAMGNDNYFKTYWAPYIKGTVCSSYQECGYSSNAPWIMSNGSKLATNVVALSGRTTFYTNDGFLYVVFVSGGSSGGLIAHSYVICDINGGKGPNQSGKDVFYFQRLADEKGNDMQPLGYEVSDAGVNSNCSRSGRGERCAEKIRRDGWKILKDYPW